MEGVTVSDGWTPLVIYNDVSTMAMATAVANKDKSIMDHLAAAKWAIATAEMHGQVLAATFPDTFLAGRRVRGES